MTDKGETPQATAAQESVPRALNGLVITLIFIGVFLLWGSSYVLTAYFFPDDWARRGQFGDLFGATNALFSGLAFAGVIITILLQRRELSHQREELRLQREEMAKSREHLAEQAKAQSANLMATITQLKISALQTEVRAIEMDSLQLRENARGRFVAQISDLATKMKKQISELEQSLNNR